MLPLAEAATSHPVPVAGSRLLEIRQVAELKQPSIHPHPKLVKFKFKI
jgi:hypothetical protein